MRRPATVFAALLLATVARGQNDVSFRVVPRVDSDRTDVREALRQLFRMVGTPYDVAPEVCGTVTLSLRNVPFETALQIVTRQVGATYRREGWIYEIVDREMNDGDPAPFWEEDEAIDRAYARLADFLVHRLDKDLARALGKGFVFDTPEGRPRTGKAAIHAFAEFERTHPGRTTSVVSFEWQTAPGKPRAESYALVWADYPKLPGEFETTKFVETWVVPAGGEWRLVARRSRW